VPKILNSCKRSVLNCIEIALVARLRDDQNSLFGVEDVLSEA